MNVLLTVAIIAILGLWGLASYTRLVRLRQRVTAEWRAAHRPGEQPAHIQERYALAARQYNAAIDTFPGNLIAMLAGFKPAEMLPAPEA